MRVGGERADVGTNGSYSIFYTCLLTHSDIIDQSRKGGNLWVSTGRWPN